MTPKIDPILAADIARAEREHRRAIAGRQQFDTETRMFAELVGTAIVCLIVVLIAIVIILG